MSLQAKLDEFKAGFVKRVPQQAQEVIKAANQQLLDSGILQRTIKVGDTLPAFTLTNQDGQTVASADLLAKGPLVISFFRGVWCPYCNMELQELQNYASEIRDLGAEIVTFAPQSQQHAKKNQSEHKLSFDILVDQGNAYAKQLGIMFEMPSDLQALYSQFGIKLPEVNGDDSWTLPMPLRAVIDTDAKVRYLDINPDYTVRPEVSDAIAVLRTL